MANPTKLKINYKFTNIKTDKMLKFIKEKNGFKSYQAKGFKIYYGDRESIAGDNNINVAELISSIDGEVKMTIEDRTETKKFSAEIKIPAKIYHKIEALTAVKFLVFEK